MEISELQMVIILRNQEDSNNLVRLKNAFNRGSGMEI